MTYIDIELENMLLPKNLTRIDRLTRRGLLHFLDIESSKSNTERLRSRARMRAIGGNGVEVDMDLARIEQSI